jgi:hypothetical protein
MQTKRSGRILPLPTSVAIDLANPADVARWCSELEASEERLREAIACVGSMPAAVRFYLNSKSRPSRPVTPEVIANHALMRERSRVRRRSEQRAVAVARKEAPQ